MALLLYPRAGLDYHYSPVAVVCVCVCVLALQGFLLFGFCLPFLKILNKQHFFQFSRSTLAQANIVYK